MKATRSALAAMTLFAADTNAGTQEQLAAYRHQIDSLDQRIVEAHLPVTVPNREQQVIEKAQEFAEGGPLPAEAVGRIKNW